MSWSVPYPPPPITATRERVDGEIIPVSIEQSATYNNDEAKYGAGNAIDLDFSTYSSPRAGADGTFWLEVTLDKVYCVQQVMRYYYANGDHDTWTCTDTDCNKCVGSTSCSSFTLTVSTEGAVSDLFPLSDCRYGNTVKLERSGGFGTREIAIVGKSGNLFTLLLCRRFMYIIIVVLVLMYQLKFCINHVFHQFVIQNIHNMFL